MKVAHQIMIFSRSSEIQAAQVHLKASHPNPRGSHHGRHATCEAHGSNLARHEFKAGVSTSLGRLAELNLEDNPRGWIETSDL